jgi:hypothetical protein
MRLRTGSERIARVAGSTFLSIADLACERIAAVIANFAGGIAK